MSTLTSTQMNVKRSSTRVHGPPGGASQLTFGPGGFGTNAPAPEPDAENRDAVQRTDFIPQKPGLRTPYQQSPSNNNQQQYSNQQQAPPPTAFAPPQTGYGRPPPTGYAPPSTGYAPPQTAGGYGGYKPPATGYSQQGQERPQTMGWGRGASGRTQPPLTSSKRDQNWEKKRRQWLARKSGGSGNYTGHSSSASSFAPPMTAGGNNNSYGNPPSPLSKLMNNVSVGGPESNRGQSFSLPQQFRAPMQQQYQAPPQQQQRYQQPPPTAYAPPNQGPPSHGYGGPPPTGYSRGGPPPTAASNYSYQDHSGYPPSSNGPKQGNVFQQTGAAQFGHQPQQFQRMPTSGSMPPTASSSRSTRQAPGGTSNWSPYG
ncbi:hypothetical protein SPRG_15796 [Saprolegnia parasitica CBS 223.65]|uniref:Uncharacterized protein n=1 Tax=Saprolegnia parasitica (strain CBS 223.65) TaxID=695850 RepID=A0A067BKD5_SAPPC|nr:hypothetical protein SPRG_15796 [Saprolegnia parasitica CBS 223.65]KDO18939.1 hypothetical protein SPRG_15796 [Saprolegnia parasitica CBS 223.65]|eukprot:XP_012210352.1 hypothetical protein SPRG_15796 [Saprolegnia parasitica CBS 223.65]